MNIRMKILISILIFCFATIIFACGQIEVLPSPDNFRDEADWFFIGMTPDNVQILEIRAEDLAELKQEDMRTFTKLETVLITFTKVPDALFSEKQIVIDMVEKNLDYLAELQECPALKNIALQVGEMLFIKDSEIFSKEEANKQNLVRAGKAFAEKIKRLLPQVTIYAHNWGW